MNLYRIGFIAMWTQRLLPVLSALLLLPASCSRGATWLMEEGSSNQLLDNDGDPDLTCTTYSAPFWTLDVPAGEGLSHSLDFDGSTQHARLGATGSQKTAFLPAESFSVEAWVKWDTIGNPTQYVAGNRWSGGYALFIDRDAATATFYFSGDTTAVSAIGTTLINDGGWHHLQGVYDPTNGISLYVDGNLDGTDGPLIDTVNYDGVFAIAARNVGSEYFFHGRIAKVALNGVVLPPPGGGGGDNELAYWLFDEGSGGTAVEDGGNADLTLTLYNGAGWTTDTPSNYTGNHALDLDGINDYARLSLANSGALAFGPDDAFEVEAWIRWDGQGTYPFQYIAGNRWSGGYELFIDRDSGAPSFIFTGDTDSVTADATVRVDDGEWHHLRGTYSPDEGIAIFVDGQLERRSSRLTGPINNNGYFAVGARHSGVENFFSGQIDEVRISHDPYWGLVNVDVLSGIDLLAWDGKVQRNSTAAPALFRADVENTTGGSLSLDARIDVTPPSGAPFVVITNLILTPGTTTLEIPYQQTGSAGQDMRFQVYFSGSPADLYHESFYRVMGTYDLQGGEVARGYVSFKEMSPFERVFPYSTPMASNVGTSLSVRASPGEYEPVSFCVYNKDHDPLSNATVQVTALTGPGGATIPTGEIDLCVVKVWYAHGAISPSGQTPIQFQTAPARQELVPELLLKSDDLIDVGLTNTLNFSGVPDDAALLQPVSIPLGRTRQFWITVRVPEQAVPGLYHGTVTFTPQNAPALNLDLTLEVLPIELAEPSHVRGIYYRHTLFSPSDPEFVDINDFRAHLQDMLAHGLTTCTAYDAQQGAIQLSITEQVQAGMTGPHVVMNRSHITALLNFTQTTWPSDTPELLFYVYDEPNSPTLIEIARAQCEAVQGEGGETITAITKFYADQLGPLLDTANYSIANAYNYIQDLVDGSVPKSAKPEWYYFSVALEEPVVNRMMFGWYLEKNQLDGCFPYAYRHVFGPSAFDDLDSTSLRDLMTTYPEQDGGIPTVQWEACREGVDDLKYLATLKRLIQLGGDSGLTEPQLVAAISNAQDFVDSILDGIAVRNPAIGVSSTDQAQWREQLIDEILAIQSVFETLGIGTAQPANIVDLLRVPAGIRLEWTGNGISTYYVEFNPAWDGSPASWSIVWTNPPDPGITNWMFESGAGTGTGNYRVRTITEDF